MPSQRKGHKGRKAAKEHKVRQARKHREARQTRRDRKDRRHHEATRVGSAEMSFHRFPDLPLELREMIWDKCIPSRLVFHGLKCSVHLDIGVLHNQRRPPIVAHVCHEARRVALCHGSRITLGTWHPDINVRLHRPDEKAWFDTRRDTLLFIQTQYKWPPNSFPGCVSAGYWMDISMDTVVAAKTSGRLSCMWPYLGNNENRSVTDMLGSDSGWLHEADVGYAVKRYYLLAPPSSIVESSLFGLFGENRAIAVDLDDTDKFRKLKQMQSRDGRRLLCDLHSFRQDHGYDIDIVSEYDLEQMAEHGKAWWLSGRVGPEIEQIVEENPEARLLALVFSVLDDHPGGVSQAAPPMNRIPDGS